LSRRRYKLVNAASGASAETNDLTSAVTWANIPDANVPESAVTQHAAAVGAALAFNDLSNTGTDVTWDGTTFFLQKPLRFGDDDGTYPARYAEITNSSISGTTNGLNVFFDASSSANYIYFYYNVRQVDQYIGATAGTPSDPPVAATTYRGTYNMWGPVDEYLGGWGYNASTGAALTFDNSVEGSNMRFNVYTTGGTKYRFVEMDPDTPLFWIRDNLGIRISDDGDTDYIEGRHDGTDFTWTGTNTTDLNFDGFTDIDLMSGMALTLLDSTNSDRGRFYHDGTDFNTDFTGTTDWNITGITNFNVSHLVSTDGTTITASGTEVLSITRSGTADLTIGTSGSGDLVLTSSGAGSILIDGYPTDQEKNSSTVNGKTANYTLALADEGETIRMTGSTAAQTITIPANASIAFPVGTMIGIENDSSVDWSLAITTDTLTWSKDNTTGTRTLAAGASAVIHKVATTSWKVSGSALVT